MNLLAALPLAPVLAVQALRVRRSTPRLPEAAGSRRGVTQGDGEPYRLGVLGESTAAGVGAATQDDALAGHLARELAQRLKRPVEWQVAARTGARARRVADELVALLDPADLVVVALGVNDLLELTRLRVFESDLTEVLKKIPAKRVLVAGMPPVGEFPSLPRPLRTVMGRRAAALDQVIRKVAGDRYTPMETPEPDMFAEDGFHPSSKGYARWAEGLATHWAASPQG
ncbi:SGNH/GDSL hydrolase family protein [Nonomuraea sp. NPDC050556]|uniref:SGNH/GDSL hydrolase family protein n=1 Tax=Nonomuraea sp. NPDC050556 TaxID=3364369 RepID=UPI0037BA2707